MPPQLLVDLDAIDLTRVVDDVDGIRKYNPQRYEFEQLQGIIHFDPEAGCAVGYRDIRGDEFWVRGHIPGRPLFPGVLMCEAAAQLSSYCLRRMMPADGFLGFAGLDEVKFRGQVVPGDRLYLLVRKREIQRRRAIFDTQGVVNGRVVFQAIVTGMYI